MSFCFSEKNLLLFLTLLSYFFLTRFWVHECLTVFKSCLHFCCDNLHILCTFFTYIGILYFYNSPSLVYSSWSMNSLYLLKFAYGNTKQSCYPPPPQPNPTNPYFFKISETFILVKCFYAFLNVALWSLVLCLFPSLWYFFFFQRSLLSAN